MNLAFDRTDRQSDQVWIILQSPLQASIVTSIREQPSAASDLKCARHSADHIAIPLTVQLDLSGLVPHQLRLVASFGGAQLVSRATGQQNPGEGERYQAHQQQHCQYDVKKANSF
jgi:hypothetical protein